MTWREAGGSAAAGEFGEEAGIFEGLWAGVTARRVGGDAQRGSLRVHVGSKVSSSRTAMTLAMRVASPVE